MNTTIRLASLTIMLTLSVSGLAAVPGSLSHQGYLTDSTGSGINADTTMTFSIYNAALGGVPLWSDTQLVAVDQGLYSVELGNPGNPFPAGLFDGPLWIGVDVESDGEMVPRRALTSVGFAFEADNALSLQGQGPAVFDQSSDIADLQSQLASALASIATLQADLTTANATITTLQIDVGNNSAGISGLEADVTALQNDVGTIQRDVGTNTTEITTLQSGLTAEASARTSADDALAAALIAVQSNSVLTLGGVIELIRWRHGIV